jgi:hypothetical protein
VSGPAGTAEPKDPAPVATTLGSVSVSTLPGTRGGPVDVSVSGKRITLPGTDEAIPAALGPPLRRD